MKVLRRDYFTCVVCNYRSKGNGDVRVGHIKPFSLHPELRFEITNGRTLCLECDGIYGWNFNREKKRSLQLSK